MKCENPLLVMRENEPDDPFLERLLCITAVCIRRGSEVGVRATKKKEKKRKQGAQLRPIDGRGSLLSELESSNEEEGEVCRRRRRRRERRGPDRATVAVGVLRRFGGPRNVASYLPRRGGGEKKQKEKGEGGYEAERRPD